MMTNNATTAERPVSKPKQEIINESQRLYESCLVTSKSHFETSKIWSRVHLWIGLPSVVLAAIAGTLAFVDSIILAGIFSIVIVVLTSIATFLNPKERSAIHHTAGSNYDSLLTRIRTFWSIKCWMEDSDEQLAVDLENYSTERARLNGESPQPLNRAYERAKKGIERGEADFAIDKVALQTERESTDPD